MYYVYILESLKDKIRYTGVTENLRQRLTQHNRHQTKSTISHTPYQIIWYCAFREKQKAYNFERYLKSSSGFAFRNKHLL